MKPSRMLKESAGTPPGLHSLRPCMWSGASWCVGAGWVRTAAP